MSADSSAVVGSSVVEDSWAVGGSGVVANSWAVVDSSAAVGSFAVAVGPVAVVGSSPVDDSVDSGCPSGGEPSRGCPFCQENFEDKMD